MINFIKNLTKHTKQPPIMYIGESSIKIKIKHKELTEPSLLTAYIKKDNVIFLGDINTQINGKGHGTQMLTMLINYAKDKGYKKITGYIDKSDADDHFDRLNHFYKKFGFTIEPTTKENHEYEINLDISQSVV